ncbi:MAG: hypothetical protein NT076_02520 [Candidatus Pacearchaeota archaeon]|nr:hypothetical protein [Candidatus Pacearchaeota archaeon]
MILTSTIQGLKRNLGFVESGCFFTHRDPNNIFRKFDGFGISVPVLAYLQEQGIGKVEMSWNNQKLTANTLDFYTSGLKYADGNDIQMVLPRKCFTLNESKKEVQNGL